MYPPPQPKHKQFRFTLSLKRLLSVDDLSEIPEQNLEDQKEPDKNIEKDQNCSYFDLPITL